MMSLGAVAFKFVSSLPSSSRLFVSTDDIATTND